MGVQGSNGQSCGIIKCRVVPGQAQGFGRPKQTGWGRCCGGRLGGIRCGKPPVPHTGALGQEEAMGVSDFSLQVALSGMRQVAIWKPEPHS